MPRKVQKNKTKRRVKHRSRRHKTRRHKTRRHKTRRHKTRRSKTSKHKVSQRKANKRKSRNKNQLIIDNRYRVIKRLSKREYKGGNPEWWDRVKRTCGFGFQLPESIPYEFINKLGEGGQGDVYLVQDIESSEKMAMKVGPSNYIDHEYAIIRRMMDEVSRYNSGINLVGVYRTGVYNDPCNERLEKYLIMDYITGADLFTRINERNLDITEMVRVMYQITRVVDMMHSMSPPIYHRDIKSENIMVTSDGDAYLIDFGFAIQTEVPPKNVITSEYSPMEYFIQDYSLLPRENLQNVYTFEFTKDMIDHDLYGIAACMIDYCSVILCGVPVLFREITDNYVTDDNQISEHTLKFLDIDAIHKYFNQRLYEYLGENHPFVRLIQSLVNQSPVIFYLGRRDYVCMDRGPEEQITMSGPPITTIGQLLKVFNDY